MNTLDSAGDLHALVQVALGTESANLNEILQCIASRIPAFGCALWEIAESANGRPVDEANGRMLTVAAWWASGVLFAMDDVPLRGSPVAQAALRETVQVCVDIQGPEGGPRGQHPFWKFHNVRAMCAVPVRYLDGGFGAVSLYRTKKQGAFQEEEIARLKNVATILPGLVRAVRERVGLGLIGSVDAILRRDALDENIDGGEFLRRESVRDRFAEVCAKVRTAFDCVEVSLFLESETPPDKEPTFDLEATTEERCVALRSYTKQGDVHRLTGSVLAHGECITIPDLAHLSSYADSVRERHPKIDMDRRESGVEEALEILDLKPSDTPPPLSFMAVPVFGGSPGKGVVRGALRCYMARSGPYFFSSREVNLLEVVAAQIGQWWAVWRARKAMYTELKTWGGLANAFHDLNRFALSELQKPQPDKLAILRETLKLTASVVPGAELNGVRLYDPQKQELYFAGFTEVAEANLRSRGLNPEQLWRFPVSPDSGASLGVKAWLTRDVVPQWDTQAIKGNRLLFPNVKGLLVAPIGTDPEPLGVLDLRWTTPSVSECTRLVAKRIGDQLAVYFKMAEEVAKVQAQRDSAEKSKIDDMRAYEDFAHQLRSPTMQAKEGADAAVAASATSEESSRARILRGMIRRVSSVVLSMRVLGDISRGCVPRLERKPLQSNILMKRLIELAADTELLAREKRLRVHVEREGWDGRNLEHFSIDFQLLEQMLANLLDNAAKYSENDSTVRVFGSLSSDGRLIIAVANRGLRLKSWEKEKCKQRGWRSEDAKSIETDGQGIGLWVVDEIMRAHGGYLLVNPRDLADVTEMWLAFRS